MVVLGGGAFSYERGTPVRVAATWTSPTGPLSEAVCTLLLMPRRQYNPELEKCGEEDPKMLLCPLYLEP